MENQIKIPNSYLFVAHFADKTIICQDESDISRTTPDKNQYFDVLEKEKESKLISFLFVNDTNCFGVDLRDGHFEINGTPIFAHREELGEHYADFRLIQCRRVEVPLDPSNAGAGKLMFYILGWQTTFEGKNVQRIIKIFK